MPPTGRLSETQISLVLAYIHGVTAIEPTPEPSSNPSPEPAPSASPSPSTRPTEVIRRELQVLYETQVKSVFAKRCFSCHNSNVRIAGYLLPFLGRINPLVREVYRARRVLDMADSFPDVSSRLDQTPESFLQSIQGTIEENFMPPRLYRTFRGRIRPSEKRKIKNWIAASKALLRELGQSAPVVETTLPCRVRYLLKNSCYGCHNEIRNSGGVGNVVDLANVARKFVNLEHPEDSQIYKTIRSGNMPLGGDPLSPEEQKTILDWIESGENSETSACRTGEPWSFE